MLATLVAPSVAEAATDPPPPPPPVTENEFLPEERNLGDCVGALERPGCGSEERGGWRLTLVLVAVGTGLVVIIGRIVWAARRNRQHT